jgi:hypothetical protein
MKIGSKKKKSMYDLILEHLFNLTIKYNEIKDLYGNIPSSYEEYL